MRKRTRCALAAITAAAAMAIAVSAAPANQIEITEGPLFRAAWTALELSTSGGTVRCPVTLLGYFNSDTMGKTSGTTVAEAVNAIPGGCTGGSVTALAETLPWHLRYSSFSGTLPNITGLTMNVQNAGIRSSIAGLACLAASEASHPLRLTYGRVREGELSELSAAGSIPLRGTLCELAGEVTLRGRATVTLPDETSKISAILETRQANGEALIMTPDTAVIPPGTRQVTVVLRNRDANNDATVGVVGFTPGLGSPTSFGYVEKECETMNPPVLRKLQGNACNLTIEYIAAENLRPRSFQIRINYTINGVGAEIRKGVLARAP